MKELKGYLIYGRYLPRLGIISGGQKGCSSSKEQILECCLLVTKALGSKTVYESTSVGRGVEPSLNVGSLSVPLRGRWPLAFWVSPSRKAYFRDSVAHYQNSYFYQV